MSVFCRHNRFTADCPICSKGTVLDSGAPRGTPRPRSKSSGSKQKAARTFSGAHVATPPYDADTGRYIVRLERVPGGVRLGMWSGSLLIPAAPLLGAADLADLAARAGEALAPRDAAKLAAALDPGPGREEAVSRGRTGDFKEELRIGDAGDGRVQVARWVFRPGSGWELQDAAPMLPVERFAQAIAGAVRCGLVPAPSDQPVPERP